MRRTPPLLLAVVVFALGVILAIVVISHNGKKSSPALTLTPAPTTTSTFYPPAPKSQPAQATLAPRALKRVKESLNAACRGSRLDVLNTPFGSGLLTKAPGPAVRSRFANAARRYQAKTIELDSLSRGAFPDYLAKRRTVGRDLDAVSRDLVQEDLANVHVDLGLLRQDAQSAAALARQARLRVCA